MGGYDDAWVSSFFVFFGEGESLWLTQRFDLFFFCGMADFFYRFIWPDTARAPPFQSHNNILGLNNGPIPQQMPLHT